MGPLPPKDWPQVVPPSPDTSAKCGICHNFVFEPGSLAKQLWEESRELSAYIWEWFLYGPHCQFCNVILELFYHAAASLGYDTRLPHQDYRLILLRVRFGEEAVTAHISPPCRPAWLNDKWSNQLWYLSTPSQANPNKECTSCPSQPSPWTMLPTYDNEQASLLRAARTISNWLSDCPSSSHESPRCANIKKGGPTRLLHIGDDTSVYRLVETKGMSVRYTALSYCWGREPERQTKENNYEQRLQGHKLTGLPRLLTDAIELTALCGLQYIWIDALCIIQDRVSDLEYELLNLPETYANATFTISAAHAKNVHCALVPERKVPSPIANKLAAEGGPASVLAIKAPLHGPLGLNDPVYGAPWPALTRSWTFQERLLSRRVVHFSPDELIWECPSHILCECGEVRARSSLKWTFDRLEEEEFHVDIFRSFWVSLIQGATQRKVTREDDRLMTVSGLAQHFARHAEGQAGSYVAGLWSFDLVYGISWSVQVDIEVVRKRPSCWVAPSWSWASIKSEIIYLPYDPNCRKEHSELITVDCKPQSMVNPFGQVSHGTLSLRGPCVNTRFDSRNPMQPLELELQNAQATGISCDLFWDVPPDGNASEVANADPLKLLLLWGNWPEQSFAGNLVFVLLRAHRARVSTWQRVGLANVSPPEEQHEEMAKLERWVDGLPMEVISIM